MKAFERTATDTISRFVHICTAEVNKYARKGIVVVKKFIANFRTTKFLFLLKIITVKSNIVFGVFKLAERGEFAPDFQVLSKFSLVFINTTASSEGRKSREYRKCFRL